MAHLQRDPVSLYSCILVDSYVNFRGLVSSGDNSKSYGDIMKFRNAMDRLELAVSARDFHSKFRQHQGQSLFCVIY